MPIGIMLKSKIVRETLKAKGYDLNQVETGEAQIDEDLKGLLERLADDRPVVQENGKEEPEVTILRKSGTASDRNTSKVTNLDGKEVVQSLVEKIPAELLEQTRVRRKRVEFKEEAEYLGPGQESGSGPRPQKKKTLKEKICPGSVKCGMRTRKRAVTIKIVSA